MTAERLSILELLPSHRRLVARHQPRLGELTAVAVGCGQDPYDTGFIIASTGGSFGTACLDEGAGPEFLVSGDGHGDMVVPLDVVGVLTIIQAVVPEALPHAVARAAGTVPVLVVDDDDEPCLVLMAPTAPTPKT